MRTVVLSARRSFLFVCLMAMGLAVTAASAAERRIIQTPEADYSGFDYNTLKNVDINQCRAACLADNKCAAFTYNTKATWCFMKSDFTALSASPGAIAGRVVAAVDLTPSLERTRLGELAYLPGDLIDEGRALVGELKMRYPNVRLSYAALRTAGVVAARAGRADDAAANYAQALSLATEAPEAWLDFARASLARTPQKSSDQIAALNDASAAAIDAYLRAETVADRASALALAGDALARRQIWKPAIGSYKASLALVEVRAIRDAYEKAVAEHGFRVVNNTVEADSAVPQVCVQFSDDIAVKRPGLADFVTVEGGPGLAVDPQARQICIDGVKHGVRYTVRLRAGLPAADGEALLHPVELSIYVRDRSPWVGFAGNSYILPAGADATIPISSVNTDTAKATIYRVGDRALAETIRSGTFLNTLSRYSADDIANNLGEKVWEGEIGIKPELNQNVITAIPIGLAVKNMQPGAYVITAAAATGKADEYSDLATQWFIVTDLGLTTLSGNDGVHVMVRSLATAKPVPNAKLRLVAVNNEILGEAATDAAGYARFQPGLARGTGGRAPQLVTAENSSDYAFIDLTRAAFDLTDRGVGGRPAPKALDVFLTPERGIYRPGETVHLTAIVRDARANAVTGLPITLTMERPDGVEATRAVLNDGGLGGYTKDVALDVNAMRGSWRVKLYADPKGLPVAETSVLVEDFEPERLEFALSSPAMAFDPKGSTEIDIAARYLYGAPAPDLTAEGEISLRAASTVAAYPGYSFGLAEEKIEALLEPLPIDVLTDAEGKASFDVVLPELPTTAHPFSGTLAVRLTDTNGRAIQRTLSLPVGTDKPLIGVKTLFTDGAQENSTVAFEAIFVGADGKRAAKRNVAWKLERIDSDYQWYRSNGRWNYEVVTNATRVGGGTVDFTVGAPTRITADVTWGDYRLTVQDDTVPAATSVEFYAGWYRAVASSDTPDTLQVSLDKAAYKVGDVAHLKLDPRFAGVALISVIDDRLIATKAVDVPAAGATVDLDVTDAWGPGAYVTATLYRPMDLPANRMPSRALGLAWAKVSPGDRQLNVALGVATEMRPRQAMTIPIAIGNLPAGAEAYVTVAAVDVGILNLTNFKPPAPDDWYFGQRRLGVDIRDVYGLLIDRTQGALGTVRSGGDGGGGSRLGAPPPTQKLLAFYSGIVRVGADGKAAVSFDIPEFNGSVRVMAMAWSKDGVGHATKDVIVRDPVVVTASIPRFLAVGDTSRLLIEIDNVAGAAGNYTLSVASGRGLDIATPTANPYRLDAKQRLSVILPIKGNLPSDTDVRVSLAAPGGETYGTTVTLGVRAPGLPVTQRTTVAVAANGGTLTLDRALTARFVNGTASVAVSLGGAGPLDVAGIMAALDRYPYGCVEQITSRAMPLVYLDDVAVSIGLAADQEVRKRVQLAVAGVLADQAASGAFGLWGPEDAGGNLWLDAYVTDFLTRAADKNYEVPALAKRLALDNLANRVAYAADFSSGGEDIAYALYVLARNGRAAIGDLRYYADSKLAAFSSPLSKAQIGAAMSLYGDRQRADRAFTAAMADLNRADALAADRGYRADYGSNLRDSAAVLTLAAETKSGGVDLRSLATRIAASSQTRRYTSTQENAWMLLAAAALIKDSQMTRFQLDGATVSGPLFRTFTDTRIASGPVTVTNLGTDSLVAVVAATGVPIVPEPVGGNGFKIVREVFDTDGKPVRLATVKQNDRFVVLLRVTAENKDGGHMMIVDPIPAGFEIENPDLSFNEDVTFYPWLTTDIADHTEARTDRFMAAMDRFSGDPLEYSVAYTMRAVSPGVFTAPAATVEDMYRPERNARTATGKVEVVGPTR
jgi:uncharacterized protein YfaS (alpha-2-macroglobulin family)